MNSRTKIELSDTIMGITMKMSEGNPGALRVITGILQRKDGVFVLLGLDDMNIRGPQIWVAYKDHCGEDLDKLIACEKNRDAALVDTVNRNCPGHLAVQHGASFNR